MKLKAITFIAVLLLAAAAHAAPESVSAPQTTPDTPPLQASPGSPATQSATGNFATAETVVQTPANMDGIGSELFDTVAEGIALLKEQKLAAGQAKLDAALVKFKTLLADEQKTYVCFRSPEDFKEWVAATRAEEGDAAAEKIVRVSYAYFMALKMRGFAAASRKQFKEAIEYLDKAIAVAPYESQAYAEKGYALNASRQYAKALLAYQKAYEQAKKHGETKAELAVTLRGMGFSLVELGRLDEAKKAYEESLELEPGNKLALSELNYINGLQSQKEAPPAEAKEGE